MLEALRLDRPRLIDLTPLRVSRVLQGKNQIVGTPDEPSCASLRHEIRESVLDVGIGVDGEGSLEQPPELFSILVRDRYRLRIGHIEPRTLSFG